jgi:N-acetylmuramoyl-L-alanine amidase
MRLQPQPQPLLLVCLAAVMLGLGGIGWLARDLSSQGANRPGRSLLELLEDIGKPSPPPQQGVRIDPSNYGERFSRDAYGNPLDPTPRMVVLHETVYSLGSAISTFQTPHPRDEDQVSYHALVGRDGQVVFLLDPSQRAFGAGNSAFRGQWAITNPKVGGSVNNFALHVSLESPTDGQNAGLQHSGYTAAQYDGLAALLALWMKAFPIPVDQITTHRAVDLGMERADPRSFDWTALQSRLVRTGPALLRLARSAEVSSDQW